MYCPNCFKSLTPFHFKFTIGFWTDAEGDGSKARVASDPQGELQDTARLLELARVAVLLEEMESAEEGINT